MESMSAAELSSRIASATATDLTSGVQQELVRKGRCHFFERFESGAYHVQLRLDWSDMDDHGFPRLDADFYDPTTGAMDKSMRGHLAHHTDSVGDANMQSYVWEYEDDRRHLRITLGVWASGTGTSVSSGSGSARGVNPD